MPLQARQQNEGTHVMDLQSKSGCTFIKELITAAWSDLTTLKLFLYGYFNLAYGCCIAGKGGSILGTAAAVAVRPCSLSCADITVLSVQLVFSWISSLIWITAQPQNILLAQGRQQEQAVMEQDPVPAVT